MQIAGGVVPYGPENREVVAVKGLDHFVIEVLYLLRNPFKAKICYPGDYPWSSVGMYFSRRGPSDFREFQPAELFFVDDVLEFAVAGGGGLELGGREGAGGEFGLEVGLFGF